MTVSKSLLALPLLVLSVAAAACSAQSSDDPSEGGDPSMDAAEVNAAQASCSSAAYNEAFASYKAAVDHAKARARGEVCEDGTTLWEISGDLRAATAKCGKFESIIATSKWAAPVRDALKGNLALALSTGALHADLAELNAALPGTTIYGPAPGVYGNMSKLTFEENGRATLSRLHVSDDGEATWSDAPARWSASPAKLKLEVEGQTIELDVKAEEGDLHFVPRTDFDDFRMLPSECEA